MADLLPSTPDSGVGDDGDPRVIGVDSDDADDLLAALQSDTARDLLAALYDEPATPSALAEEIDTSIQNVRYHLEKLTDAELIEVADTVYSEKGREMNVYAPAAKPLVVFAGGEDDAPGLEAALSRLLGGLGVLGLSSLLVQRLVTGGPLAPSVTFQGGDSGSGDLGGGAATDVNASADATATVADAGDAATEEDVVTGANGVQETTIAEEATVAEETTAAADTTEGDVSIFGESTEETTAEAAQTTTESARTAADATETVTEATRTVTESAETTPIAEETTVATDGAGATEAMETTEQALTTTVTEAADAASATAGGLEPGLLFFAGGLVVLAALGVAWYLRAR